jgi:hypothetical protein
LPQGQIWEHALEHCRQLAHQYEEELVDYYAMADLRSEQTSLCEGEEPNHTSARKPDPLFIIQYSLFTLHGQDMFANIWYRRVFENLLSCHVFSFF